MAWYGVGGYGADAEGGGEQVGPGPQVGDGTQVFYAVALLLEGILRRGRAFNVNAAGFHLQGLLGLRRQDHDAADNQRRAYILRRDFLVVIQDIGIHNDLEIAETGAVIEFNKAEGFHIADGFGPAADRDGLTGELLAAGKDSGDFNSFHNKHLQNKNNEWL